MENEKQNILNELKNLDAKNLLDLKKNSVPEFYFENLQSELSKKLKEKPKNKIRSIYVPMSIAASILILISVSFFIPKNDSNIWEGISQEEIEEYLYENINNYSIEEFASLTNIEDFSSLSLSSISNEDLEEFILEEDFDENEFF